DYAGAVKDGAVISSSEYSEMREFSRTARARIQALPPTGSSPALLAQANALIALIDAKGSPADVSRSAHLLADSLLRAYPIATGPKRTPDLAQGAALYQQQCAACHGATGKGDGPVGVRLSPRPVDFTAQSRADQRSALSLYEVITHGVQGTPMASYGKTLPAESRWDLAYYVGTLAYPQGKSEAAARLWRQDTTARARITNLNDLSQARVTQLAPELGLPQSRLLVGYLRANPGALREALHGIALAQARLQASLTAYRAGSVAESTALALSAYLDGIEPIEPQLNARDGALRVQLETAMGAYRTALSRHAPLASVTAQAARVNALLVQAQAVTAEAANDPVATFLGAYTILVREGLEALLVVVALLAFLRRAERFAALRYVHAGWSSALLAGAITWALARYAISISGANRELTEGVSSVFAAAVLVSVGLWMHGKSVGGRWQTYLKSKMTFAVNQRSAWFLFGLAFISVYREVFETILFYVALWNVGEEFWLLAGIGAGAVTLGLIAWVLLRTSRRLPIAKFFSASSVLIAVLAVVLTGKGVSALQEAGWAPVSIAPIPHIELLGVYPTWQTSLAQLAVLLILAAGFAINSLRGRGAQVATVSTK
ncbi:MAG TPA: FTR1 family protein, partial [Steroidobacteraceae bacterium]|nr:FTR1 family protein [Steroidobacteraceae bacterium]